MLKLLIHLIIISLFMIVFVTGCDENNPVESEENHFAAIGLFIISSGDTIVKYQGGEVTGEIEVTEGTLSPLLSVKFISEEGDVGIPQGEEWALDWVIEDTAHADLDSHGDELAEYRFHIRGKEEGTTNITIIINHNEHKDFESKPIPIHIEHGDGHTHGEPEGLILIQETTGDTIVTYDGHHGELEAGNKISVAAGEETGHIMVWFFDHDENYFRPDEDHHSLMLTIADTTVAHIHQHEGEVWEFGIEGEQEGNTTLTVDLWHEDYSAFKVEDIPVEVTP